MGSYSHNLFRAFTVLACFVASFISTRLGASNGAQSICNDALTHFSTPSTSSDRRTPLAPYSTRTLRNIRQELSGIVIAKKEMKPKQEEHGGFSAPIAVFEATRADPTQEQLYVLVQQNAYLVIQRASQPNIQNGYVTLYRGIGQETDYRDYRLPNSPNDAQQTAIENFLDFQYNAFANPNVSTGMSAWGVNHDLRIGSGSVFGTVWAWVEHMTAPERRAFEDLFHLSNTSYSLLERVARDRFGPNFVRIDVPLDNIRLIPQDSGEFEVRIVDPTRVHSNAVSGSERRGRNVTIRPVTMSLGL